MNIGPDRLITVYHYSDSSLGNNKKVGKWIEEGLWWGSLLPFRIDEIGEGWGNWAYP